MRFTGKELEEIVQLRIAGMTLKKIGLLYGASEDTVAYALRNCDSEELKEYCSKSRKGKRGITQKDIIAMKRQVYLGMKVICKYDDGNGLRKIRVDGVVTKTSRYVFVVKCKQVEEAFSYTDLLRKEGVQIA